ncbi:uncharacterized protein LOC110441817 [Mizuhopecten yessoensis]|uniref:Uncharacterized protein n=1 Tax=Mizuhopecten yessoensis TaxID=6573 RepID=A0A210PIK3_MIZYE|nr:uncharacterized protein LOC110441817 [Mizuhopecten yessoensis]OWF36317.1 hypothetical protein KP79_PYT21872 [Mizuhopecten yessoensis]
MDGHGDTCMCTNGHVYMCGDAHGDLCMNATNEPDLCADKIYSPGQAYIDPSLSYSRNSRKRILETNMSFEEESNVSRCGQAKTTYIRSVISTPGSGDGHNPLTCPDNNPWSALLTTSQINTKRRDVNNNTKKRAKKKDKKKANIIIPCGEQLQEHGAKSSKFTYELPPLRGVPRGGGGGAQRSNLKVSEVILGVNCSNIITARENMNLESRLTYLDKTEYRPGFRASTKKAKQNSNSMGQTHATMSFKLPKLVENEQKSEDYDQKNEKSVFKLPSIVGTTCRLDASTKQYSTTTNPEVPEDSGSTWCSLGNVKLPPIGPLSKGVNGTRWKNKYGEQ